MKVLCLLHFVLIALASYPALASAESEPSVKICATWKKGVEGHCLEGEKTQILPGRTLFAITEQVPGKYRHEWNGAPAQKLIRAEGGRRLVSSFKGGDGEGRTVDFALVDEEGKAVLKRSFDVRWADGHMVAQGIDDSKPLEPEAVADPEKPAKASMPTVTEAPRAAEGGVVSPLNLRRGEVHFAFLHRSAEGTNHNAFTFIPYWNPEYRLPTFFGFGVRLGGTFWDSRLQRTYIALESDVHLTFPVHFGENTVSFEPALGMHWWQDRGFKFSPGIVLDWMHPKWPVSALASFSGWEQDGISQRLFTIGLGKQF